MKLETLKSVLENARPFLAQQDFLQILQHFAFDGKTVTAYNDISACQFKLDSNLSCTIPGNLLLRLLSTLAGDDVEIKETKTKTNIEVVCGRSRSKLPILPLEDFVFSLPETEDRPITLTPDMLEGIKKCLSSVSINPTKPEFNGITFTVESHQISMHSTDGKSISRFMLKDKFSIDPTEQIQVILPAFFCQKLIDLHPIFIGKNNNVEMKFGKTWSVADLSQNYIFTRVIDRKPPDCESAIAKYAADHEKLLLWGVPIELQSILERASLFLDPQQGINTTQFTVNGNEIQITTKSSIGTNFDTLEIPVSLGNFSFSVDPNLMLRAFKICKRMTLKPQVVILQSENFLHLIATATTQE